ncbi:MAG: LPS export ABC transporter periplasmic protein LptC [Rubrivivax sp.]|mgnify:CR=1 FL=1|nr:LPS export ABC transporter periplasmic protein LptC [Rubrivivax sp.]MCW5609595.1 LPS export ABC transporter periplasmic protein LptC [Rubrivivax sp.]
MSVELHLPDLPEVPISVGARPAPAPGAPRPVAMPWHLRLRELLAGWLPLLLMLLLALATWWLVENSPRPPGPVVERPVSPDPDYTMTRFALERFDAEGRLKLRIEGAEMRHYPADDRFEVDAAQIRAIAPDGRVTLAQARRAVGSGDGSELQLLGGAQVTSTDGRGQTLVMRGEFLHAFLVTEQIRSHLPVQVRLGASELRAAGLEYDHPTQRLELKGPMRVVLPPRPGRG